MWELYAWAALTVFTATTALWALSVIVRDASIIDVFWGPLFVAIAWVLLAMTLENAAVTELLLVFLVTVWGLRLAFHLAVRNIGHGEDARYRLWRTHGGPYWWLKSYYRVYLLQGAIALVVATPIVATFHTSDPSRVLQGLGVMLWAVGLGWEAIADVQLGRFKARPDTAERVMDHGLWRYTRHPNYFGDALMWWGLGLYAFSGTTWWSFVGPLAMTLVFLNVSNDVIERGLKRRRPDYESYIRGTSAFFPLPPRAMAPGEHTQGDG